MAALVLLATEFMARSALQGVEQALVSTVIEWSAAEARRARTAPRKYGFAEGESR
ncbi:MAG TPA: hypothetical protein VNN77_01530 [candidate division Zixibacteria bacterium]|nr:hypothetical protein [candidate division Zixibacteria bacterium]